MRAAAALLALVLMAGCAGLDTAWRFQAELQYRTPADK